VRRTRREAETVNEVRGNLPKLFRRREDQLTGLGCEASLISSSEGGKQQRRRQNAPQLHHPSRFLPTSPSKPSLPLQLRFLQS
jgi:hypothetical protein